MSEEAHLVNRTILVTGSANGIGKAVVERLRSEGHRPIGLDLEYANIIADLATPDGRALAVAAATEQSGGKLDGLIACAGIASADTAAMVAVNYFGTVALIDGIRPLLAAADAGRAVAVSSSAIILGHDDALVDACLADDEPEALRLAENDRTLVYASTKVALSRWIRCQAIRPEWAGANILLNAIAPGAVLTRMTQPILASEEGRAMLAEATPIAVERYAEPEEIAPLLTFLAGPDLHYVVGQTIFVDGGKDVIRRGDQLR